MSRSTPTRVVVVEVPAEARAGSRSPGSGSTIPLRYAPCEKNCSVGRLAAQLVLGVVQVGEVLDLRDRHEAAERRRRARARGSRSRRAACRRREPAPNRAWQPARDAVDTALHRDVLAEDERLGVRVEHVREPALIDCASVSASPTVAGRRRAAVRRRAGSSRRQRAHHLRGGRELRQRASPPSARSRTRSRGSEVVRRELVAGCAAGDEPASRREQRVAVVVGADLGAGRYAVSRSAPAWLR